MFKIRCQRLYGKVNKFLLAIFGAVILLTTLSITLNYVYGLKLPRLLFIAVAAAVAALQ